MNKTAISVRQKLSELYFLPNKMFEQSQYIWHFLSGFYRDCLDISPNASRPN